MWMLKPEVGSDEDVCDIAVLDDKSTRGGAEPDAVNSYLIKLDQEVSGREQAVAVADEQLRAWGNEIACRQISFIPEDGSASGGKGSAGVDKVLKVADSANNKSIIIDVDP